MNPRDNCGTKTQPESTPWRYTACGLDYVWHAGVDVFACMTCGNKAVVIPHTRALHALLARGLAARVEPLSPAELRYLRTYIGWSRADFAAEIADLFGASVSTDEAGEFDARAERYLKRCVLTQFRLAAYPQDVTQLTASPTVRYVRETSEWNTQLAA